MNLPAVLRKALKIVQVEKRAAYLQSARTRYRLIPSTDQMRGYTILLSVYYDGQWQPWSEVHHFGVDDILYDKWKVA